MSLHATASITQNAPSNRSADYEIYIIKANAKLRDWNLLIYETLIN